LPTHLPDKAQKPKWAKPRKTHGKASARSLTGVEVAKMVVDKAEKSSKVAGRQVARSDIPEESSRNAIMPDTPPLAGES
jgi:hypothetical protein